MNPTNPRASVKSTGTAAGANSAATRVSQAVATRTVQPAGSHAAAMQRIAAGQPVPAAPLSTSQMPTNPASPGNPVMPITVSPSPVTIAMPPAAVNPPMSNLVAQQTFAPAPALPVNVITPSSNGMNALPVPTQTQVVPVGYQPYNGAITPMTQTQYAAAGYNPNTYPTYAAQMGVTAQPAGINPIWFLVGGGLLLFLLLRE